MRCYLWIIAFDNLPTFFRDDWRTFSFQNGLDILRKSKKQPSKIDGCLEKLFFLACCTQKIKPQVALLYYNKCILTVFVYYPLRREV